MIKTFSTKFSYLCVLAMLPFSVQAVQPMSESDLEVVSATTGDNILNIFGASQAGLRVDEDYNLIGTSKVELEPENNTEGEATNPIAFSKLRTIEADNFQNIPQAQQALISNESKNTLLKLSESTKGNNSVFATNSEINYKTSNVHHDTRTIDNGGVAISRDLKIDLLKLENLSGDNLNSGRSAGNIYLSDWSSRGDTRIISTQ